MRHYSLPKASSVAEDLCELSGYHCGIASTPADRDRESNDFQAAKSVRRI